MRRKIWEKRKKGQLRKKNEKLLGSMFFIFLFFTSKVPQIGACGYFFSKNLGPFFTVDFSYLLGASSNCLTCLRIEPALGSY
jgi:hypothetical protein